MCKLNSFRIHMYIECMNRYSFVHVYTKPIQFIHSMCMCIRKLYRFTHSMYMCMRKLFNLHIRCTCVCESYSIYISDVHAHTKPIQFLNSMYMRIRNLSNLYIRSTCVCESIHKYIECMNRYSFRIHIECIN
jgi:hypothetical protein